MPGTTLRAHRMLEALTPRDSCGEEVPWRQGPSGTYVPDRGYAALLTSPWGLSLRRSFPPEGFPKNVRMANLACIGSRKVNGVAEVRVVSLEDTVYSLTILVWDLSSTVSSSSRRS